MNKTYDGIILGSGHNSLILQAYLGRAGLRVLCLELRDHAGGGLATMEDPSHPGFYHNTHSFFHRALDRQPWYSDLNLEERGARYVEPDLNSMLLTSEGRTLSWWTDFERTLESFRQFDSQDADTVRYWRDEFRPIVEKILIPESQSPPLPDERRRALLEQSELGRTLLEVSTLSPLGFVKRYFNHPVIQAGLLFFNGLREVDLRVEGFGHHIPMLLASPGKAQMARGGSAELARALISAVEDSGGEIRRRTRAESILVENDRAVGVRTSEGETIRARRFIASGLNPHQTFLELMEEDDVPSDWRTKTEQFQYNVVAPLFGLNLNLEEPPRYEALRDRPDQNDPFMVILGLDDVEQYTQMVESHEQGTVPPTIMWGACPTRFDSSQAPPGKHTAFMWEKMPYNLHGDPTNWDDFQTQHGETMLRLWKQHAPNLKDAVIDSFVRSPLDTERTLPNMREGDLLVGSFDHGQIGYNRPFPGAGHYRAHLENLYLCGSSSHPGGNITGLVGYNCAQVLLADLDLPAPWSPPPIEEQLKGLP